MKSFIAACAAAVLLAIAGSLFLGSIQELADQAYSTIGVRLGA